MPFSVRIDQANTLIQLTCTGTISAKEMMDYEREYWVGDRHLGFHHIVDFRNCELDIDFAEVLMLATHASPTEESPYMCARSAFIVQGEEQTERLEFYKHARHQTCDPAIREVGVFFDEDKALAWVGEASVILL